jgi:small subunit ribosomal protein S6
MRRYELMLVVRPDVPEDRVQAILDRSTRSITGAEGQIVKVSPWGRRRLAYEIAHKGEAVYHLLLFTCPVETLDEITRVLKITDGVVRHGAYRRVQGSTHQKAPAQAPAPAPASAAAGSADDSDEAAE